MATSNWEHITDDPNRSLSECEREEGNRTAGSNPAPPASSHTIRALRLTGRRAEWQVSWGFCRRPVDWPGAENAENRSPEANSLRTS